MLYDISIPLKFEGSQPNAFGADVARSRAYGDTRTGSSVNFEQYTFTPHCNGTHTECIGHITDERISVRDCLEDVISRAVLVSVTPVERNNDLVIALDALQGQIAKMAIASEAQALIVRTLPNDERKQSRKYGAENIPAYFTANAMEYIVECGFKHLLVDLPSIDRINDDGKLENHRIFWNVEPESRQVNSESRIHSTITELIYVPNEVADGDYLLNLQIAPFASDAAPSRPVLIS